MTDYEMHALRRTNPKGQPFVGTCMKCGKSGLTMNDMNKPCPNTLGLPNEVAVMKEVYGDD